MFDVRMRNPTVHPIDTCAKGRDGQRHGPPSGRHADHGATVDVRTLFTKQECMKAVKELNREIARYSSMVLALGSLRDSHLLREELKRTRRVACELARQNKSRLLPHLRGNVGNQEPTMDYEKMWNIYRSCLEMLHTYLSRTVALQTLYPLHLGQTVFIHTGLTEPVALRHKPARTNSSSSVTIESLDGSGLEKWNLEREELRHLELDLLTVATILSEVHDVVDVLPWSIEPEIDTGKLGEGTESTASASEASTEEVLSVSARASTHIHEVPGYDGQRRRRCICLLSVVLLSVVIFATVLGVCIALLS